MTMYIVGYTYGGGNLQNLIRAPYLLVLRPGIRGLSTMSLLVILYETVICTEPDLP